MENILPLLNKLSGLISVFGQLDLTKVEAEAALVGADLTAAVSAVEKAGEDLTVLLNDLHAQVGTVKKQVAEKLQNDSSSDKPAE